MVLLLVLVLCLCGCTWEGGLPLTESPIPPDDFNQVVADWSVSLFREGFTGQDNYLISPLSVLMALSMTANGAGGETLAQMENVWGIGLDDLNQNLHAQSNLLQSGDLHLANSIWLNQQIQMEVLPDFLKVNRDYYQAEVREEKFNRQTVGLLNDWVNLHTQGMIQKIVDELAPDAVMYLVNVIAFDAQWEETYGEQQLREEIFEGLREKGKAILMKSDENIYLNIDGAVGFIKPYAENKFSFVGILPDNLSEFIAEMDGGTLVKLLNSAKKAKVDAYLPQFTYDNSFDMTDLLCNMGMKDAFDAGRANFSKMARMQGNNIYIDEVLHKTFIAVDELGTKAAAVTSVGMRVTSVVIDEERYEVKLNRPFIYLIVSNETNWPVFMGAVLDL